MLIRWFFMTLAFLVMMNGSAHAYIDPGVASIVLQTVVGAIAAVLFFCSGVLRYLKNLFRFRRSARDEAAPAAKTEPRSRQ